MTPLQILIQQIENQMFSTATNGDHLYIVRAMAELLLEKEQDMFQSAYEDGYIDGTKRSHDIYGFTDKLNEGQW
jgi:hypothetical protein